MKTIQVTANQLAEKLGVDYATANAIIKLMIAKGVGREAGEAEKTEKQRGKAAKLYELQVKFEISLE